MLKNVLEGFGVLALSNCSIGFKDILDGRVHISLKGKVDELILNTRRSTANF